MTAERYGIPDSEITTDSATVQWLVNGLFEIGDSVSLAASAGCGKTTMMQSIAEAVAHGQPWCGRATTKGKVLFFQLDELDVRDGDDGATARLWTRRRQIGPTPNLIVYGALDSVNTLAREVLNHKPVLVVIDVYSDLPYERNPSEPDYDFGRRKTRAIIEAVKAVGATLVMLTHTSKSNDVHTCDPATAAIGTSGAPSAADCKLVMGEIAPDSPYRRLRGKMRARMEASDSRIDMLFRFDDQGLGAVGEDEAAQVRATIFTQTPRPAAASRGRPAQDKLLSFAHDVAREFGAQEVVEQLGIGPEAVRKGLHRLVAGGELEQLPNKAYRLPLPAGDDWISEVDHAS